MQSPPPPLTLVLLLSYEDTWGSGEGAGGGNGWQDGYCLLCGSFCQPNEQILSERRREGGRKELWSVCVRFRYSNQERFDTTLTLCLNSCWTKNLLSRALFFQVLNVWD
jgi:hypothetical protein